MPLKRLALLLIAIVMLPVTVWAEEVDAPVDDQAMAADADGGAEVVETEADTVGDQEAETEEATVPSEGSDAEIVAQIDPAPEADSHAEDDSSHSYFYMGGAFTVGIENFDKAAGRASSDEAYGFDMWLGYRMNRYLAVEGRLSQITGFDTEFEDEPVTFELLSFTGNLKMYPIEGMFQPYAIFGVGTADLETKSSTLKLDSSGILIVLGGGIDIYVLDRFSLLAEIDYLITDGDVEGFDLIEVKVGVQFQF